MSGDRIKKITNYNNKRINDRKEKKKLFFKLLIPRYYRFILYGRYDVHVLCTIVLLILFINPLYALYMLCFLILSSIYLMWIFPMTEQVFVSTLRRFFRTNFCVYKETKKKKQTTWYYVLWRFHNRVFDVSCNRLISLWNLELYFSCSAWYWVNHEGELNYGK